MPSTNNKSEQAAMQHNEDSSKMSVVAPDEESQGTAPAEPVEIGVNGRSYQIGDHFQSRNYKEMTKSLYNALAALDTNGDGIIDDGEIAEAARSLKTSRKHIEVLRRLLAIMIVAILLVAASTFGVSLWANKLSKDIYTHGDTLTNSHGETLKTREEIEHSHEVYELVNQPWEMVSNIVYLNFVVQNTKVHFTPSVITQDMEGVITFRANGDTVVLTADTITFTPMGGDPMISTKEDLRRSLQVAPGNLGNILGFRKP